jgi:hypothetical protein
MDAKQIIDRLRETPFKYTQASKVRDYLKKQKKNSEDIDDILFQLRKEMANPANADISKAINEIVKDFKKAYSA